MLHSKCLNGSFVQHLNAPRREPPAVEVMWEKWRVLLGGSWVPPRVTARAARTKRHTVGCNGHFPRSVCLEYPLTQSALPGNSRPLSLPTALQVSSYLWYPHRLWPFLEQELGDYLDICMSSTPNSEPWVGGLFFTVLFLVTWLSSTKPAASEWSGRDEWRSPSGVLLTDLLHLDLRLMCWSKLFPRLRSRPLVVVPGVNS